MALQICQFVANYDLGSIPSRILNPQSPPSNIMLLPDNEEKFIKKIAIDCVINQPGDICVLDYSLTLFFVNEIGFYKSNDRFNIINPTIQSPDAQYITIYKENPVIDVNFRARGIRFNRDFSLNRSNKFVLTNNVTPLISNLSYLITLYYER